MDMNREKIKTVTKREASSGKVSYTDPIVLSESTRTRKVVVPFYIPRSHGNDLAIKLQTYAKKNLGGEVVLVEDKSFSLDEAASRKLLETLREVFAVAKEGDDGDYILIKVSEGEAQLGEHKPEAVAAALTKALSQRQIVEHLSKVELSEELSRALQTAIRLNDMRTAVAGLREALDGGISEESFYQKWCEDHSWAFGNAYVLCDEVREITPSDNLDILLPSVITGFRDVVELKRPDVKVLNYDSAHRNHYFSADTSKAIGQVQRYLDVLHEVAAKGLRDHPEIVAYHPRAIVVIGRSSEWDAETYKALRGLNHRLFEITIITYDHLLAQGERVLEILDLPAESFQEKDDEETLNTLEDDIPF